MTDNKTDLIQEAVDKMEPDNQDSPGTILRKGREKMGLSQQDVANQLHLRLNNVQDIESDTHQPKVSITFTKGYVRIYAKFLGIDAQPLLDAFDVLHQQESKPAKLQSFSRRVAKEAHDERWMMVTYLVVFLVIASFVIWWFQQSDKPIGTRIDEFSDGVVEQVKNLGNSEVSQSVDNGTTLTPDEKDTAELTTSDIENSLSNEEEVLSDDTKLSTGGDEATDLAESTIETAKENLQVTLQDEQAPLNVDSTDTTAGIQATQKLTQDSEPASTLLSDSEQRIEAAVSETKVSSDIQDTVVEQVVGDSDASTASEFGYKVNADGTVEVVFTFKDDCWVSVRDVNKETMAYGVKKKGRVMTVSGIPPIRVILGAPQNVEIDFGGQPVDMTVHPAGRSANFKLPVVGE